MKYLVKFVTVLAVFTATIYAQNRLTGQVEDAQSGEVLRGANVLVQETQQGAATDEEGRYTITGVPDGRYTVSASYVGYEVQKKTVRVSGGITTVDFQLRQTVIPGQNITVTAHRATRHETPVPFTDVTREEINRKWQVEDVPMLLEEVPNVFSYSESGNGIGYSYMKIRGFDQRRLNVTINGIPLNDPEDHNVYWVDIPNLLANVQDIQVQRGVGTSLYGQNAMGGSVNLVTSNFPGERQFRVQAGYGSYDTRKYSFDFQSGLIDNTYSFYGRFSRITTDGYRHSAWSELWSYFLSGARYGENTTLKINVYGGPEKSHAAWDASPKSVLEQDHRANPYSDYANETDNFNQPHYELIHDWDISDNLTLHNSLFYIRGDGYYEQLKNGEDLWEYGLVDVPDSLDGNLVRQKWVEKDQYGWIPRLDIQHTSGELSLGAEISSYSGLHYGKLISLQQVDGLPDTLMTPADQYYNYTGDKFWTSIYAHELYNVTPKLKAMIDVQYQYKTYAFQQNPRGNFVQDQLNRYGVTWTFFNPKVGLNYSFRENLSVYGSFGRTHREPSDDDLYDTFQGPDDLGIDPLFANADTVTNATGQVQHISWTEPYTKPEQLSDFEAGVNWSGPRFNLNANGYLMLFNNEIVPYGSADEDGFPIKGNAERTIHYGLELSGDYQVAQPLTLSGNLSLSRNFFDKFIATEWNSDYSDVVSNDYSGNPIALFPSVLANFRANYQLKSVRASIFTRHVGKQYLDNTGKENRTIDPFTTVDLNFGYQISQLIDGTSMEVSLKVKNVLDERYETSGYWYGEPYLYPAAGRNYFVSVSYNL